jgi:hypothetical protein
VLFIEGIIMRKSISVLSALLILGVTSLASAAETKAVQAMAGILTTLQHFPSTSDKQILGQIVEDKTTTDDERTVAKALLNVQHKVAAGDKASLDALVANAKASSGVKTLAGVILSLNHMPSADDKAKLGALAK